MEILSPKNYQELLGHLPHIKASLKEWQLVDIRLTDDSNKSFTVEAAVQLVHSLFKEKEGKIYSCNEREILMLIRWGREPPLLISEKIEATLPAGSCKVVVQETTPEGLGKLEILIQCEKPSANSPFAGSRLARRENIILVADDDMYIRLLVKKGSIPRATTYEAADGNEVIAAYKKYRPDILFLDIHLPGRSGMELLSEIMKVDSEAYIIMLSADSSQDNVVRAIQQGAKGFMAKPFDKEKLVGHFNKCPTFS